MPMHNALDRGQTYSSSFKRLRWVETLEHAEEFIQILHVEADSIISNEYYYVILFLFRTSNFDFRPADACV